MPSGLVRVSRRKVQLTGGSSLIVSIPKEWAEEMGIGKGSEVTLIDQAGKGILLVPNSFSPPKREAVIEVSKEDSVEGVMRELISLYLSGYTTIGLRGKDGRIEREKRARLKELVRRMLVGVEVMSDVPDYMVLHVFTILPELSVMNVLKRMAILATSMHKEAMEALRSGNLEQAEGVIKADDDVDRFALYVTKMLNGAMRNDVMLEDIGVESPSDCLGLRVVVKSVERIADHASKLARLLLDYRIRLSPKAVDKLSKFGEDALGVFADAMRSLFTGDPELANRTVERARRLGEAEEEVLASIDEREKIHAKLVSEHLRRVAEYASDIAEIVHNMTFHKTVKQP